MPNPVVRFQILSPEPNKAAEFYQKLFDWELSTANALGYRELRTGEKKGIDGGIWPAPQTKNGFVQLFIEVADVDRCIAEATSMGAKVLVPKCILPDGDAMAVLLDPLGVSFAVCSLSKSSRSQPAHA
jgi:predicted enzyme related to lactoylglutathione lyase